MTITGQVGHIGIGVQDDFKTDSQIAAYEPTFTNFFVVTGESIVPNNSPLMADGEIGRGRDRTGAVAGGYGIAGGFQGNGRVSDLGYLLEMGLNNTGLTADGSTGVTTIVPTDYLDWFSIEKNVGNTLYLWYINSKVNSLTITAAANALVTYSVDFVVTQEKSVLSTDATTPSYTDDDLLAFHGGLLTLGGSQYNNMESVEIAISNGLSNDEYTVRPSRFLNGVTEGARTFDLNFSQVFNNKTDYENYTYGEVGRTTPGYALYEDTVQFILMNAQSKATATQWLQFDFPRVMFGGLPVALTSGRIVVQNQGIVLAPSTGNIIQVMYK
jgi:hypothetical protein